MTKQQRLSGVAERTFVSGRGSCSCTWPNSNRRLFQPLLSSDVHPPCFYPHSIYLSLSLEMTASSSSPRVLVFAPSAHLSSPAFGIAKARRLPEAQHAIRQALLAASLSSSGQQNGSSNGTNEVVLPSPEDLQAAHDDLAPILQADRAAHELTAKLFLPSMSLAPTSPAIIEDAISQLGRLLGETVWPETVVLAWPDVRYEGVETDFSGKKQRGLQSSSSSPRGGSPTNLTNGHTQEGCGSMKLASRAEAEADRLEEGESEVSEVELGRMVDFWTVSSLVLSSLDPPCLLSSLYCACNRSLPVSGEEWKCPIFCAKRGGLCTPICPAEEPYRQAAATSGRASAASINGETGRVSLTSTSRPLSFVPT